MPENTILVAVAPNGARRSRKDHPALPITPGEIAETALACAEAGAAMIHLHVRDEHGEHTLDPGRYQQAVTEIKQRAGDSILVQVSSEAAGSYTVCEQVAAMEQLMPECVSLGLREYLRDEASLEPGAGFLERLYRNGTLVQYILYSPEDVRWYEQLCKRGIIPGASHLLLFVLGRYGREVAWPGQLAGYFEALQRPAPWMVCAFGPREQQVFREAITHGGHCRVGFENNLLMTDGRPARDNAEMVRATADLVRQLNCEVADADFARRLYP